MKCFVELFDGDHFQDDHFKLTEPGRYSDLTTLPGASQDWTDEADSIKAGPGATVTIWADAEFKGKSRNVAAGSHVARLAIEPSSLEMTC